MDLKEIKQIIELMTKNELSHFHLERDGMKIKLKKGMDADALGEQLSALQAATPAPVAAAAPAAVPATAPGGPPPAAAAAPEDADAPAAGEIEIASPMVGTFYTSSSPEAGAFVEVGGTVKEGAVICIVEAMKVMNEIKAEQGGTITRIVAENGTPVQYGEPLFHIRPS